MHEVFKKYLDSKIQLSDEEFDHIKSLTTVKKLRKNQYLLQEGDLCNFVVFVASGCLRTYTVDKKDLEHIVYFAIENWWAGDRESYLAKEPSNFNIDAVEESVLIMFSRNSFEQILQDIPAFKDMINNILQKSFVASQNRIHAAISYSAEEKYLDFIAKYPALATRLPLQMIASYLGITPETLSRVRALTLKKNN